MMIRVSGGFLDFDDVVEVERQVKLFENIDETWGDYSYSFELAKTSNNIKLLGYPMPDNISKRTYQKIEADVLNESGEVLYSGYLRIENISQTIRASFFAGNNNWMSLLSGNMTELEISKYDQEQTVSVIESRASASEGIVFPLIDTGALQTRSWRNLVPEDFVGCFFLKTLFKEVFLNSGLKLAGEILQDPIYNTALVATNTRSKIEVDNHSMYVGKNNNQVIVHTGINSLTWNLTTDPYFIGDAVSLGFSNTAYRNDVDMIVDIEASWQSTDDLDGNISLNSAPTGHRGQAYSGTNVTITMSNVYLFAGGSIQLRLANSTGSSVTVTGGHLKVTPRFIYKAFGRSSVPLWTKSEFVNSIISLFNLIPDYDPTTKTVTLNFFNKLKSKPALDISEYVEVTDVDYTTFISNYGKNTVLSYEESSDEDLREYNISSFYKYGEGVIQVENEFLQDTSSIMESPYSSPISYIHPHLNMSIERVNFVELDETEEMEITSVTNSSGTPRFNIANADLPDEALFSVGDLVRLKTTNINYNGDYVVDSIVDAGSTGYFTVRGLVYTDDATGDVIRLIHNLTSDDSVYLLINTGPKAVSYFSPTNTSFYIKGTEVSTFTVGFFNLIKNGTAINLDFRQSLSFGQITDPLFYQKTMLDTYWGTVDNILNDPVMLISIAHLPLHIYRMISPLTPVFIKTMETTNEYYVNRITGYKESYLPCTIELIKLP